MSKYDDIVIIACGVFRPELEFLRAKGMLSRRIHYIDSRWHMDPTGLRRRLDEATQEERGLGNAVVLLYGDCHPHMVEQSAQPDVVRIPGANCCRILLGKETHKFLLKEKKAFILLPEWAERWREILVDRMGACHMGLDEKDTIDFLRGVYSCFVYVDTGVRPVPQETLTACAKFFEIPCEVHEVCLDRLLRPIEAAIDELAGG